MPLVFLHHLTAVLVDWDPAVVDGLAVDRRILIFNNRGVGGSDDTSPDGTNTTAEGTTAFIEALGLAQVDRSSLSLGSFRAQLIARPVGAGSSPDRGGNVGVSCPRAHRVGERKSVGALLARGGVACPALVSRDGDSLQNSYWSRSDTTDVQLALFGDYKTNVALHPAFQKYFRTHKPSFVAAWSKHNSFFLLQSAKALKPVYRMPECASSTPTVSRWRRKSPRSQRQFVASFLCSTY